MKKTILTLSAICLAVSAQGAVSQTGIKYTENAVKEANAKNVLATSTVNASASIAKVNQVRSVFNDKGTVSPWVNEVETNLVEAKMIGTDYLVAATSSALHGAFKEATVETLNGNNASLESLTMRGGKITNLKAGEAATDAVNVSQLKEGMTNVKTEAAADTDRAINNLRATTISPLVSSVNKQEGAITALEASQESQDKAIANIKTQQKVQDNAISANTRAISSQADSLKTLEGTIKTQGANFESRAKELESKVTNASAKANRQVRQLRDLMKERDNKLRKGIAGVIAHANLPQATQAGGNTLGVSGGYYADKTAVAVGYSRLSDNAKHTFKLSVGYDGAYVNAGAGYGYNWK